MTTTRTIGHAVLLLASFAVAAKSAEDGEVPDFAKERPEVKSGEPAFAFNGEDLSGFYTYLHDDKYEDPGAVFTVEGGMIRISGEQYGAIITEEEYGDYHLIVEWKWGDETFEPRVDRARDSGLLLHGVGPDGAAGGQWLQSQECQIIEGGCGDFIMVGGLEQPSLSCVVREGEKGQLYYDPEGGMPVTRDRGRYNWWGRDPQWKDEVGYRGPRDVEAPAGEWNRMEVICDGDAITNIVNGFVVNAGTGSSLTRGKILLQSEGAELFCRRFEVRPLSKE